MKQENTKTQEYTTEDVIADAKKLIEPSEEEKQRKKHFFENFASLVTVLIVALTIVLYAFNKGFCNVYNLPINCMPLDLKSYIPVAVNLISLLTIVCFYLSYLKTDIALKRKRFNPIRVMYVYFVLEVLSHINGIDKLLGAKYLIPISILLAVLIELCVYAYLRMRTSPRKNKKMNRFEYDKRLENIVQDWFIYSYLVKYGVSLLIISTLVAPIFGRLSAKTKLQYQTTEYNHTQYAVIVEYNDRVLVQPAIVEEGVLKIETERFEYLPKDNLILQYIEYDRVIIQ